MRIGALPLVLFFVVVFAGCSSCGEKKKEGDVTPADAVAPPSAVNAEARTDAASMKQRPVTTTASISLSNLDADIAQRLKKLDGRVTERLRLIDMLLTRAQFLAKVSDLETADDLSKTTAEQAPKESGARYGRAIVHAALHRFDAATTELDEAEKLGASAERIVATRVSILMARGKYDEAAALVPPDIDKRSYDVQSTAAVIAARQQKLEEAERLFELARERFNNVAPFPLAWMDFQRATVLDAAGKDGRVWYAEAVDVLPPYAHAVVHVAATEAPDAAIARLEAVRTTSEDDGDVLAALADAHDRAKHVDEAKRFVQLARARYTELLKKHPEAYADHAARFFIGAGGDPQRALQLARDNAKVRVTEEALDLWMATAAAAAKHDEVCAASIAMTKLRYLSEKGRMLANAAAAKCPDAGQARP